MVDFETPAVALFDRLKTVSGVTYATRVLEDWDAVAPPDCPALMLLSLPITELQTANAVQGMTPQLWRAQYLVVLYVKHPEPNDVPATLLNTVIAGVVNALQRQAGEATSPSARFVTNPVGQLNTTLGGLCAYCRAFGTIERQEGLIGGEAVAHIPIEMVLTS